MRHIKQSIQGKILALKHNVVVFKKSTFGDVIDRYTGYQIHRIFGRVKIASEFGI